MFRSLVVASLAAGFASVVQADGTLRTDVADRTWRLESTRTILSHGSGERVFVDGLRAARDLLPLGADAAFILDPPSLILAIDETGDGVADRRSVAASGLIDGRSIVLGSDGRLFIEGTRAQFRWNGSSLTREADRDAPLGNATITAAGDLLELSEGMLRLTPGDAPSLADGARIDYAAEVVGALPGAPPGSHARLLAACCDPESGQLSSIIVERTADSPQDSVAGFVPGRPAWRWTERGFVAPKPLILGPSSDASDLALLVASPDPRQRARAVEAMVMRPREETLAKVREPLRTLAASHADATVRRLALVTLGRLGAIEAADIERAASDRSALVRRWARSAGSRAGGGVTLDAVMRDPRMALMSVARLDEAIRDARSEEDHLAILRAARGRETLVIERALLFAGSAVKSDGRPVDAIIERALDIAIATSTPTTRRQWLEFAAERLAAGDHERASLLAGAALIDVGPHARRYRIVELDRAPLGYRELMASDAGERFAQADAWVRWPGRSDVPAPPLATTIEETIELGRQVYTTCLTCHGPAGRGQLGVYPPLGGSAMVNGDPEPFAKILLHGLQGRLETAAGEINSVMPRPPIESDEEIAAVMTYVRQAFGNQAGPVSTDLVRAVRERHRDRTEPWKVEELKAPASAK
jgi:mono/diheme cytochrome c family protein